MASCAILELRARIEYFVSSASVRNFISETFIIGDLPFEVMQIVQAEFDFAILSASTISVDEPECEMPIATSFSVSCDAAIDCI